MQSSGRHLAPPGLRPGVAANLSDISLQMPCGEITARGGIATGPLLLVGLDRLWMAASPEADSRLEPQHDPGDGDRYAGGAGIRCVRANDPFPDVPNRETAAMIVGHFITGVFLMSRLFLSCLTAALTASPLAAHADWYLAARLSDAQSSEIRRTAVARGRVDHLLDRYIPYFLVVANENRQVICNLGSQGLDCFTEVRGRSCPSTVEVRIAGVAAPANVPVTCVGPDAQGHCDCEFTPQG